MISHLLSVSGKHRRLFQWLILGMVLVAQGVHAESEPAEAEVEASETEPASESEDLVFPPEIEALLSGESDLEGYGAMERCIRAQNIRSTQVLDDRHVVFELPSRQYFLVQFERTCHRLRRGTSIMYEPRGSQLCRLDQIRAVDSLRMGDVGPPCSIPGFYPVTVEQVALLRETLQAR